jgi:hypothetical protein
MPLLTANRDIVRTLEAVPGLWNKLHYLAKLREESTYGHWGLIKIHGEAAATEAIEGVHQILVTEILRRSIPELVEELDRFCKEQGDEPLHLIAELVMRGELSLPPGTAKTPSKHFSYVMSVVSNLLKARRLSIRPTA